MVGLACYVDQAEQDDQTGLLSLPFVSGLFRVVSDAWIDALTSFLIVVQAAHLAYKPEATAIAISSKEENQSCPFLGVLTFVAEEGAKRDVQQVWDRAENASSLITECKEALLGK
eukprot:m.226050 g.226050  ORF g.226050 m.226050 type:complete len:115 (+) comp40024_c0_seq12:1192-1536(+)